MSVIVSIDVGQPTRDQYLFDYANRTVRRASDIDTGTPDLSDFLQARMDFGTKKPRLVGWQTDEFTGLTDSWNDSTDGAAALCDDIGLVVNEWSTVSAA